MNLMRKRRPFVSPYVMTSFWGLGKQLRMLHFKWVLTLLLYHIVTPPASCLWSKFNNLLRKLTWVFFSWHIGHIGRFAWKPAMEYLISITDKDGLHRNNGIVCNFGEMHSLSGQDDKLYCKYHSHVYMKQQATLSKHKDWKKWGTSSLAPSKCN